MTDTPGQPHHPIQPLTTDDHGVIRFKSNAIVRHLLDHGGLDMNHLAVLPFSREDREQFAQLIGYSHSGAHDLGYMSSEVLSAAEGMHQSGEGEMEARNRHLRDHLKDVKDGMRAGVAELFGKHPDDLEDEG